MGPYRLIGRQVGPPPMALPVILEAGAPLDATARAWPPKPQTPRTSRSDTGRAPPGPSIRTSRYRSMAPSRPVNRWHPQTHEQSRAASRMLVVHRRGRRRLIPAPGAPQAPPTSAKSEPVAVPGATRPKSPSPLPSGATYHLRLRTFSLRNSLGGRAKNDTDSQSDNRNTATSLSRRYGPTAPWLATWKVSWLSLERTHKKDHR